MFMHFVLHEIAMFEARRIAAFDPIIEMLGDEDAAVHAARAANGNDELTLALLHVLRQEERNQPIKLLLKLLCDIPRLDIGGDLRDGAALIPQRIDVERIRQEAHIKDKVGIERNAVLKPEREDIHVHLDISAGCIVVLSNDVAQLGFAQVRRIDQLGCTRTERGKLPALTRHPLRDPCLGSERMWAACLLVAAYDHVVGRLHKEQLVGYIPRVEFAKDADKVVEELAAARIHHNRRAADLAMRLTAEIDEFRNKDRWQIVHAEIAQILHIAGGERFSAARQSRHDHRAEFLRRALRLSHRRSPHSTNFSIASAIPFASFDAVT